MKNLINSLGLLVLAVLGVTTFTSCDPCSTVVCPANSVCNTGACACNAGYEKIGATCSAANKAYVGTGTIAVREIIEDSSFVTLSDSTGVIYTFTASTTDPYAFTIENFMGNSLDDITFLISSTAGFEYVTARSITTAAGINYFIGGSKTGSQIILEIRELQDPKKTYKLRYNV